ncbi:FIMAH domain-containing protein [Virgibacillus salexigens]|uniref:FIMAH domain-containing protein n=1 Tax=Virgibacillus massiliensis TaxID=1462526 RepID=UPI00136874C4|nr:M14 family zinc carboxypeptidase [Virgibacillus massiliensis]MYL41291.1 carboxypeptidase [Virgibacillus massiliensis]
MTQSVWKKAATIILIGLLVITMTPVTGLADETDVPTTGFEDRNGDGWTTQEEELAFLEEVAATSDRVAYSEIGTTVEGRPLHLVRVGFPAPPTDEEIADGRNMLVVGSQHGNEGAPREMALQLLRNLAFTDDPVLLDQLQEATILFIPTANPDGRAANTRANAEGIDINREHLSMRTNEVKAIASVLEEFTPDITVDGHERPRDSGNPDMEMLWPRNLNVDEQLRSLNQEMVEDYLLPEVEEAGFTTGLYGSPGGAGGGDERILRNILGLRNGIGLLTESAGLQEPQRRVDMQMRTLESVLSFYRERFDDVGAVVSGAPERQQAAGSDQTEPFYLDGADNFDPTTILETKPSGYLLTNDQTQEVEIYKELFAIETEAINGGGMYAAMDQPKMGILPFLFDERATYTQVEGIALYDSTDVGTAANMKSLVAHFEEEGEFEEAENARALDLHLTAVDRFEKKEKADKVIKHMHSFNRLLAYQRDNEFISELAYSNLQKYAAYIIGKWETSSDSTNVVGQVNEG